MSEVLKENVKLKTEGSTGNLCQRLAKEAIFSKEVMKKCTPAGMCDYLALPQAELYFYVCEVYLPVWSFVCAMIVI